MNCSLCGCSLISAQNKGSPEDPLCKKCADQVDSSSGLLDDKDFSERIVNERARTQKEYDQRANKLFANDKLVMLKGYMSEREANRLRRYLIDRGIYAEVEPYGVFGKGNFYRVDIQQKNSEEAVQVMAKYLEKNH